MDSEQTLRRPIPRHYIIPRRYVKFNRKTRPPQRKDALRGKTVFPLPKPTHKKFYFRQDRAACCRGENCYILTEYPLDRSQLDWTTFGEP